MYAHVQSTAAQTWYIDHQLGGLPVIEVIVHHNGTLQKILPRKIRVVDNLTIVVEFSSPRTGIANVLI